MCALRDMQYALSFLLAFLFPSTVDRLRILHFFLIAGYFKF